VADVVGAATLVASQAAVDALTARARRGGAGGERSETVERRQDSAGTATTSEAVA